MPRFALLNLNTTYQAAHQKISYLIVADLLKMTVAQELDRYTYYTLFFVNKCILNYSINCVVKISVLLLVKFMYAALL